MSPAGSIFGGKQAWQLLASVAVTPIVDILMETPRAEQSPLFARRELGVLLHPTSLFGTEDVGTLGRHPFAFVDWLEQAGATLWQILLLTPNGRHNSPYFSPSAFAGNP